jgi:glycosyltransferase involved in cell wall biosynthesis
MSNRAKTVIIHFVDDLNPGGIQRVVVDLVNHLDANSFDSSVMYLKSSGVFETEIPGKAHSAVSPVQTGKFLNRLHVLLCATRFAKRIKADYIIGHNFTANLLGALSSILSSDTKFIAVLHSYKDDHENRGIRKPIYAWILNNAAAIVAVSETVARAYLRTYPRIPERKVHVICNCVDTGRFRMQPQNGAIRSELGLGPEKEVIGTVGHLTEPKALDVLITAMKTVTRAVPDAVLVIVGTGHLKQKLEDLVEKYSLQDKVFFLGSRRDIPEIMNMIDLYALSSIREGLPVALLEAMACGKPAVATRAGGVSEILLDGETGLLVEPSDPHDLAEKIIYLLQNRDERAEMGLRARLRVERNFSIETMCSQFEHLIREPSDGCSEGPKLESETLREML